MRHDPVHIPSLTDTDLAETPDTHDHMGRRHVATIGEAFAADWPWIVALLALMVFVIGSLAGHFRL
jgi:hypothetical protein